MAERKWQPRTLSTFLGTTPGFRWVVDGVTFRVPATNFVLRVPEWVMPPLLLLAIPLLIAWCVEWRMVYPLRQYRGVFPGDMFLSLCTLTVLLVATQHLWGQFRWYSKRWWHISCLGFVFAFAAAGFFAEYTNMRDRFLPAAAYTEPQFWSPSNLYHYVLLVVMGYVLLSVGVPVLVAAPWWTWLEKAFIVVLFAAWAACSMYFDQVLPRPDLGYIHPYNGGWFGGLGLQLWHRIFG